MIDSMKEMDFLNEEIVSRYGTVKRARECFLYTAKSVRLVDLFQEDGRAILGWSGSGDAGSSFTVFKNVMSRGLTGSLPTDFEYRLEKACCDLFNSQRKIFIFNKKSSAVEAGKLCCGKCAFFMPWMETETDWSEEKAVAFAPALPWMDGIYILAILADEEILKAATQESFRKILTEDGTRLNAALEAAVARSIYDLIHELQVREEKDWFIYDPVLVKYFERKGPWLFPKVPEEKYEAFVKHCLDCQVVVNPVYGKPSIVPFGADRGVFAKLAKNPFEL